MGGCNVGEAPIAAAATVPNPPSRRLMRQPVGSATEPESWILTAISSPPHQFEAVQTLSGYLCC